jgi:GWxTD domain-containing protein
MFCTFNHKSQPSIVNELVLRKILKMARRLGISMLCLFFSFRLYAIEAVTSHALFFMPFGNTFKPYIELYWQIAPASIHFDSSYTAKIRTDITISNISGILAQDHYILQSNNAANINQALTQNFLEYKKFMVSEDRVYIRLQLTDLADTAYTYIYNDSLLVSIPKDNPFYGSLQILDTSYSSTQKSLFTKNGHVNIPLCANFIDNSRNTIFYYTELYNAILMKEAILLQSVYVSKKPAGDMIYHLHKDDTIKTHLTNYVANQLKIDVLPSGNYYLNIILTDDKQNRLANESVFFQRINTTPLKEKKVDTGFEKVTVFDLGETFVSKYTLPQLMAILKMLKPIGNALENETINNFLTRPDELYMRYFIYNFWNDRNPKNPKSAWDTYAATVKEVNRLFRGSGSPGYETERGIIYLKYGKPAEMITVENENGAVPYQIWTYDKLPKQSNGGMILFYKPGNMLGEYQVLHSTIRGETRNTNWRISLYTTGKESSSMNSKAEQYFPGSK